MTQRIYATSPASIWETDRYEQFYYLLGNQFPQATILERRDVPDIAPGSDEWHERLRGVSSVVFIRDSQRCIDLPVWDEINAAQAAGKTVHLARQYGDGSLVLVPWRQLEFAVQDESVQVSYVKPGAKKQEIVKVE